MVDHTEDELGSLYADLSEGARWEGGPAPREEEVLGVASLLREASQAAPVPGDLVPSLKAALREGVATEAPAASPAAGFHALLGLLWAEARFLPLSFLVFEVGLLGLALAANRYLTGFAGPGAELALRILWRGVLNRSLDAFTFIAPWLGTGVALFAALPQRRGLWADLEALSPFAGPARLLARAAVAALVALAGTVAVGLLQTGPLPGGERLPLALLLLARSAPLFLALAWALAWSVYLGAAGAVAASLALWGGLLAFGGRLGGLDLFASPQTAGGRAQVMALLAAVALLAMAWRQVGRLEAGKGALEI